MDFSFAHDIESQETNASDETEAFLDLFSVSPCDGKEPETPYLKCVDVQQGYEDLINEIIPDRGFAMEETADFGTLQQSITEETVDEKTGGT